MEPTYSPLLRFFNKIFDNKPSSRTVPELPDEIWLYIFTFVAQPHRTALVCRNWQEISIRSYTPLYRLYETFPALQIFRRAVEDFFPMPERAPALATLVRLTMQQWKMDPKNFADLHKNTDSFSPALLVSVSNRAAIWERAFDLYKFWNCLIIAMGDHPNWRTALSNALQDATLPELRIAKMTQMFIEQRERLSSINSLTLSGLDSFPSEIAYCSGVTHLNLENCTFTVLHRNLNKLNNLQHIIVRDTTLSLDEFANVCNTLNTHPTIWWKECEAFREELQSKLNHCQVNNLLDNG